MKPVKIESARYLGEYRLFIKFSDGKTQTVDFAHFLKRTLHPDIQKYLQPKEFRRFKVEDGELMWGDFDLIFPIMDLYENKLERESSASRRQLKAR